MALTIGGRSTARSIPAMVEHFQNVYGSMNPDIFVIGRQIYIMFWDEEHSEMYHEVFEKRVPEVGPFY